LKPISPGWLRDAPAAMVICLDKERETNWSYMDIGAAMQNMLLFAHSIGVGCCPIGSFVVDVMKKILDLPANLEPVLLLTVGYPDEIPNPTSRLPVEEIIFKRIEG